MTSSYDTIIRRSVRLPSWGTGPAWGPRRQGGCVVVTRDDVLDGASALLSEGGAAGLSMRRLAERLGCSYQVVYSRVGDKQALLRALHDRGFERLAEAAVRTRADAGGAGAAGVVVATALGYFEHAVDDPVRFEVMFGVPVEGFVRDEAVRAREREAFATCWVEPVRAWFEEHRVARTRGGATALAWQLWAATHGITTIHLAGHPSPSGDPRREIANAVTLLLRSAESGESWPAAAAGA